MNDLFTAMSGAVAQERKLDIISNNLANITTAGFRKEDASISAVAPEFKFADLWDAQLEGVDNAELPQASTHLRLAKIHRPEINLSPGAIVKTDHPLDVALLESSTEMKGRAFFVVESPNGELLARDGKFAFAEFEGHPRLVHQSSGYPVLDSGGKTIDLPSAEVVVHANGQIESDGKEIARLRVVTFDPAERLTRKGNGLYGVNNPDAVTDLEPEQYKLQQGYLEQSNVNAVDELVRMIRVQRSYEAMVKSMMTSDETRSRAISVALQ